MMVKMRTIYMLLFFLIIQGEVESLCPQNCQTCYYHSLMYGNVCSSCKDSYYGTYCTNDCPIGCSKCTSTRSCSECKPDHFGYTCQSTCSNCKSNICEKISGGCIHGCQDGFYPKTTGGCGCQDGFYPKTTGGCDKCQTNCLQCTTLNSCTSCKQQHWGPICQYVCTGCENNCDIKSGCSNGCTGSSYQFYNTAKNGYECRSCTSICAPCNDQSHCKTCKKGYYGNACSEQCRSECLTCTEYDVCQTCAPGHHGINCQKSCRQSCATCTAWGNCQECVNGNWGTYCQYGCVGCKNNYCSKAGGCYDGCIERYFVKAIGGGRICKPCPSHCVDCLSDSLCSECVSGYNGTTCQHNCKNCNADLCDGITGECIIKCKSSQFFDNAQLKCINCPTGCSNCNTLTDCSACNPGRWGQKCQSRCNNCKNQLCSNNDGRCTSGCIDNYYGIKCIDECLPECKICYNGNACHTCKSNRYNQIYSREICDCTSEYCKSYNGGTCIHCTLDKWYPKGEGCCPCSSNCLNSLCRNDGSCTECKTGKYGTYCNKDCAFGCQNNICHRNGTCVSCKTSRFGPKCDMYCSNTITNCNLCHGQNRIDVVCTRCNDYRNIYADGKLCRTCSTHCKPRLYQSCNTTTGTCFDGCQGGWFGDKCDTKCAVQNCELCSQTNPNICTECIAGFYLSNNSTCNECPSNCKDGTVCNKYNGVCGKGCINGFSGNHCNITCMPGCRQCDQNNTSSCSVCKYTFFGESCESTCNNGCVAQNQSQTCNKLDGTCKFGCKDGLWDSQCDNHCGGCSNITCNRTTGYCLSPCHDTHYGNACDNQCSAKCVTTIGRSCNETNGYCLNGCQVGWFGRQCNDQCGQNCKNHACDRNNGSCTSGCIDGYTGFMCSQAQLSDVPSGSNAAAIGGGAGAGVAMLIILVVIVVVVVMRRRKTSSKMETSNGQSVEKNHSFKQTEPVGAEYSNINEARIEKKASGTFGITNLVYANAPVRMSDISEKGEATIGNTTKTRPTSEDNLKEVDIDEDVRVDEDEAGSIGKVDDTYYNIGGQRVTVTKLAEYIKQKPIKDIFNDFEKIPKGLLKSYKEAKKAKNATKNKYRAIYPYDDSRVVLLGGEGDYMNASYIDGYNRPKEYIASSGPFQRSYDTTSDFWRMIWQERCETLVMLTKPYEDGQPKCTKYWPETDEICRYGKINITCLAEDVYADFTIRILVVTKGEESLNIRHVHFTAWPDKGIPHDVTSMIELRQKVRSLHKDKEGPIIVHCSAGIGRTGTFIALDMLTYEGEGRGSVDIYGSVASLRYQRCNMVQTPEQYVYLHHAVLHSLTFDCRGIPGDMFLQNYNKLIERNGGERIIDKQLQQLQHISDEMTDEDRAQIEKNMALSNKNRKGADVPADESRVKLHENRKPGASDYINAVYVNSFRKKKQFICAQTPLPSTVVDFLSLIHQEKCTCVVSMEEPNIQDKTIKVYWPADNQVLKHGVFKVCCKDSKTRAHYVTKKLSITYHGPNGEESRDVNLFIFTNWPKDSLVPKTSDSLLELVKTVDATNRTCEYEAPILIHCGTGANRSCLYCAVSVLIEKMEIEHEVSVVNTLRQIKARRLSAISSVEQYKFCHQAVISYLQSFDIYSNFGLKEADA